MSDTSEGRTPVEKWAVYSERMHEYWKSSCDDESSMTIYENHTEAADRCADLIRQKWGIDWQPVRLLGPEDRKP